jgi:uridine kinase
MTMRPAAMAAAAREAASRWTTHPGVRALFASRLFWAALAVKLAVGSLAASYYLRDLFIPFLNDFVSSGFADPWEHFAALGRLTSFPYPPVMLWVMALPRFVFGFLLAPGMDTVTAGHLLTARLPLLLADLSIALVLVRWFPWRVDRVLLFYWASPFVIYISYWHGQLDVIPTALFVLCLYFLHNRHFPLSMAVLGLALAAKSHLWVAAPFLLVYLGQLRGWRLALRDLGLAAAVYLAVVLPHAGSEAFRAMVFGTSEQSRLFAFSFPTGSNGLAILLAPSAIVVLLFRFAAYTRRNWDLFLLYLGLLFSVFILLAPPQPGYVFWSLPFIVYFMCRSPRTYSLPYFAYAASYLAFFWLSPGSDLFDAWRTSFPSLASLAAPYDALRAAVGPEKARTVVDLVFTFMEISLAGIVLNMYLFGVRSSAVYRLRTGPVMVGVAGDSASGKDTFVGLASSVLGSEKVTVVAGDDYHRWPRGHEMWQVHTHLDVRANELHLQHEHAIALRDGKTVVKGHYDHASGRFSEKQPLDSDENIIFNGLHTLSMEGMRGLFDLKVFMDPDEGLRGWWKMRRDCGERGHSAEKVRQSLADRAADRERYILPQKEHADLVFRWEPETAPDPGDFSTPPRLRLVALAANDFNLTPLVRKLSGIPGLAVAHQPFLDDRWQSLTMAGDVSAAEVAAAAHQAIPNLEEITHLPSFAGGLNGCLQLVFLSCLGDKINWRS